MPWNISELWSRVELSLTAGQTILITTSNLQQATGYLENNTSPLVIIKTEQPQSTQNCSIASILIKKGTWVLDFYSTPFESKNGNSEFQILSICPFVCLSVCLSVRPSVRPSSFLIIFLIHTLSSRSLPHSTLVTQPLPVPNSFLIKN